MKLDTLRKLYIEELRDVYNAENQLVKALPKMARGASSDELKQAFEDHLEQTKGHVDRLEEIFEALGAKPTGKTCKAMKGLIEEGSEILDEDGEDSVLDAALIGAAQRVEHYEIAAYGTLRTFARLLHEESRQSTFFRKPWMKKAKLDKNPHRARVEEIVNEKALGGEEEQAKKPAAAGRR